MKTTMEYIILMIILITGCSEKENIEPDSNCLNCETELNMEDIQDLTCKVAQFNDTIYILTYDRLSFINPGYYA